MKVGDYYRTKYGINKLTERICVLDDIIKSSPNIIDLIEAGDVIKFIYRGEEYISDVTKHGEFCMVSITPHWEASINAVEIKSIVTKEQFESMEYKVGELDER